MAGVAAFVGLGAAAEGIAIRGAEGDLGGGRAALAPSVEGLALGGGAAPVAAIPSAGVEDIRRAQVEGGVGLAGLPVRLGKTAIRRIF